MSFLEAEKRQSLHFLTLTYNNDWLPVAWCDSSASEPRIEAIQRGSDCYAWQLDDWLKYGCDVSTDDDFCTVCPTLHREDVKNLFKRFRQHCKRHGISTDFAYASFGEYGEKHRRPHYHVLVAGLDDETANLLGSLWNFGYYLVKKIPRFNPDGSDGFVLVSDYVSKYICKRDKLPEFVKQGYAEAPRRQSSIRYGKDLDFDKLRPFCFAEDLKHLPLVTRLKEICKRKKSITYNGKEYKMPRFAHDQIYKRIIPASFNWARRVSARYIRRTKVKAIRRENFCSVLRLCGQGDQLRSIASHKVIRSPHPLYLRALAFERSRNNVLFVAELRQSAASDRFKDIVQAGRFIENRENRARVSREAFQSRIYEDKLRQSSDGQ